MAMALRSRLRPSSMNSRNGSQADGAGLGFSDPTPLKPTPNPVVTSMAGFESWLLLFLLSGRFSGLMLRFSPAISGLDPVVTSLAGFAGTRPQAPGARTAIPAAFRYALPVSRRTPVACSIRRKDPPRRPNAITCCRFSSLKTLLMPTKGTLPCVESTSRDYFSLAGFEMAIIGRIWVATEGAGDFYSWGRYFR